MIISRQYAGQILRVLSFLFFLLSFSGCSHFIGFPTNASCPELRKKWPDRPWSAAFEYRTAHYRIQTNTSSEAARYTGTLMEQALPFYCKLLHCRPEQLPVFNICAYATAEQYESVAGRLGLPPHVTTGLYSPQAPAAIHLPCHLRHDPCKTLLHEGLHQVADHAIRFSIPPEARENLSPVRQHLVSIPLWINEGLAAYMEGALTPAGSIVIGRMNRSRLRELQKLLRSRQCPPLATVLSKAYGEGLTSRDYAVCWGLIYFLRHGPEPEKKLQQYLQACRRGFYTQPHLEFPRDFLPDGQPVKNFDRRWAKHIGRQSLRAFHSIIVGQENRLAAWENIFHTHIRRLQPENGPDDRPLTE